MAVAVSDRSQASPVRIGSQRDILGECPVWDAKAGLLWWIDIRHPTVRCLDPASGTVQSWAMPWMIGAIALTEGPELILAMGQDIVTWVPGRGVLDRIAQRPDISGHRFNDGRVDRQGRFWVGTMHNDTRAPEGTLFRLDDGGLCPVLEGLCIPNSLCWSPEGDTLYFADSLSYTINRYPFDTETGTVGKAADFASSAAPAFPDGATIDAAGHLWVAEFNGGRVLRLSPEGEIAQIVNMPVDRPTACALGGADLRTLYITSTCQNMTEAQRAAEPLAGGLFALRVDVAGLPEPRARLPIR